jgi:ABC-type antimicrobial peptide transport system permease subunit
MKTAGDPLRVMTAAKEAVRSLDPNLPLRDPATMNERLWASTMEPRLRGVLFAVIGGLALALSVTGIYGVMAYSVNQRRRETAIRRALGAHVGDVVGPMIARGFGLTAAGILLGSAGALMLTSVLSTLLFQVSPRDPAALAAVAALLSAAALLACVVPAMRTARIEPATVLRDE